MLFTTTFVLFFILSFGVRHWLAQRQIRHVAAHREMVPAEFAQRISLSEHQKAADYTIAKLKLGLLENAFSAVVLIAFTLLEGFRMGVRSSGLTFEFSGQVKLGMFAITLFIALFGAIFALRRINGVEPAAVFRG